MKAITLWQPWASLLACGAKQYETRSWPTKYRGPIAIHAAARPVDSSIITRKAHYPMAQALMQYARQFAHTPGYNIFDVLPRGCIIATAELVGCWPIEAERMGILPVIRRANSPHHVTPIYTDTPEYLFGDFTPSRYAWEFANMKMLDNPIPVRGGQRIWNWDDSE